MFATEFQSLSDEPIRLESNRIPAWTPADPGLAMKPFGSADRRDVANSRPRRLLQMRSLARAFSAQLTPPNRNPTTLRMMPTPLYRYTLAADDPQLIDGAIFVFSQGTDPEVLLLIEAKRAAATGAERSNWQYGLARMSSLPMQVSLDNSVIWETEWARSRDQTGTYFVHKSTKPDDVIIEVFDN